MFILLPWALDHRPAAARPQGRSYKQRAHSSPKGRAEQGLLPLAQLRWLHFLSLGVFAYYMGA